MWSFLLGVGFFTTQKQFQPFCHRFKCCTVSYYNSPFPQRGLKIAFLLNLGEVEEMNTHPGMLNSVKTEAEQNYYSFSLQGRFQVLTDSK